LSEQNDIVEAIVKLEEKTAIQISKNLLHSGIDPIEILEKGREGMSTVGKKFEEGIFFLSDMIMAAEIFKEIMNIIRPQLKKSEIKERGRVVIGTVAGDVHDIGKNLMIALLEAEGFEVIDLGVDVSPERFVDAIREYRPDIVGMSSLLTIAIESVNKTINSISEAGLREIVKIIVGGGRIDEYAGDYLRPDAYTDNAAIGVRLCKQLLGRNDT
jgi:methylmalonyl-CoA mutase cobalamin-binding domain/chain